MIWEKLGPKALILTVGLPYSGKTTWARAQQGVPIVNPDSIRLALYGKRFVSDYEQDVWFIAKMMAKSLFVAGHAEVIVDATAYSRRSRLDWCNLFIKEGVTVCYRRMDVDRDVCIARARDVNDIEILDVILKQASRFEALTDREERYAFTGDIRDNFDNGSARWLRKTYVNEVGCD